ncbi:amidohydrolase family protein [Roseivirga sp.]|uniref:amidohydrolase family protein n=1 Tax=Roseivirga sp. TaxID=1964215 RepID=UPI003B8BFB11
MNFRLFFTVSILSLFTLTAYNQEFSRAVKPYVSMQEGAVAITHAKVVDGTGGAIKTNQTIIFKDGIITHFGNDRDIQIPADTKVVDATGKTVIPGLVMLHEHIFYPKPADGFFSVAQMTFTFPRLYLAGGVTTMRTAGSIEPQTDLNIRKAIQEGKMLGPKMDLTSPFIERAGTPVPEVGVIESSDDAAEMVNYWSKRGINSFKVYQNVTKEDLRRVVEAAHAVGKKVTGHICSVTYREAAEIGIDNIEHGFFQSSDFVGDKIADFCPAFKRGRALSGLSPDSPEMKSLMDFLIEKDVAITSTLPVFEPYTDREIVLGGGLQAMSEDFQKSLTASHKRRQGRDSTSLVDFKKQMAWEKSFYEAGGKLLAGTDPTGAGRTIAGYANQRVIELFIEAGFSLATAIKISSLDGAKFLERANKVGSIEVGKQADIVLINGDLEADVSNIRKMEIVFKDGIGFDSQKIFESMKGKVGK